MKIVRSITGPMLRRCIGGLLFTPLVTTHAPVPVGVGASGVPANASTTGLGPSWS